MTWFILIAITFSIQIVWNTGIIQHKQAQLVVQIAEQSWFAFFIDETDNAKIIEANTFIPNGSHIQ